MNKYIGLAASLLTGAGLLCCAELKSISINEKAKMLAALESYLRAEYAQRVPSGENASWSEATVPLPRIDDVLRSSSNMGELQGCLVQPALLYPGIHFRATLVKKSNAWHTTAFSRSGFCANTEPTRSKHDPN